MVNLIVNLTWKSPGATPYQCAGKYGQPVGPQIHNALNGPFSAPISVNLRSPHHSFVSFTSNMCYTGQRVSTLWFCFHQRIHLLNTKRGYIQQCHLQSCQPPPAVIHNRSQSFWDGHALSDQCLDGLVVLNPSRAGHLQLPLVSPVT